MLNVTAPYLETRRDLLSSMQEPSDPEFDALVDMRSIPQSDGRQTHYFTTPAHEGDGLIVAEFVIQEETSGFFLHGDDRQITDDPLELDPATPHYTLDQSRMIMVIDRDSGRGVITSSGTHAVVPVDLNVDYVYPGNPGGFPFQANVDNHVGSRPIEIGSNGIGDFIPNDFIPENYFNIEADADNIRIEYDAVNSVTAPLHQISVDGPIVLERGENGTFVTADGHDPDLYPAIAVTQYPTDGERVTVYHEEGKNVFEGASPAVPAEGFEAVREITENPIEWGAEVSREVGEGWNEVGEASWYRKPDQLGEAALEVTYEAIEGGVETVVDVPWEIVEGTAEIGWQTVKGGWNAIF